MSHRRADGAALRQNHQQAQQAHGYHRERVSLDRRNAIVARFKRSHGAASQIHERKRIRLRFVLQEGGQPLLFGRAEDLCDFRAAKTFPRRAEPIFAHRKCDRRSRRTVALASSRVERSGKLRFRG